MEKKIEYTNGEVTVIWRPEICQHSGICVRTLPQVYNPNERPWVKPQNATTEQLIAQIKMCPSGALRYRMNNEPEQESI
ncbi:(4Fe-4S)-binding protein [Prevotella sp. 10(H)]|uniref:(4Fe-4S)-binding protein n=1 Tax=Prevotella sp. 10(H) TaxID=1158294 RepID=UPI0004A6D47A|nr:(4Fe-4S)-binding protein [Prevotella sp. 10(H)]